MSNFLDIGERLKEERERLKMNQTDFAGLGGVTRKTQFNYESGERAPDAAYLAILVQHGVDVYYVITGIRQTPVVEQEVTAESLSAQEKALLDNYRNSPEAGKRAIRATLEAVAEQPAPKTKRKMSM